MSEQIKEILTSNKAKATYWQLANGILTLVILVVANIDAAWAVAILPFLNTLTKIINQNILQK